MEITAGMVKQLREATGVGMMDCKKALAETNGDMEAAIDWLRTRGLAKAAKKADRVAAEGLVGVATSGNKAAVVEVNSETDFVARNEQFQNIVGNIAKLALDADGDVVKLGEMPFPGSGHSVSAELTEAISKIGENMNLRRTETLSVSDGVVESYVHSAVKPGMGKIGILVGLESTGDKAALATLGKQLAMHIAAAFPQALDADSLDPEVIERERKVAAEKAAESGKPENVQEKMVDGAVKKFAKENALLSQLFVMDNKTPIADVVAQAGKEAGKPIKLVDYVRFQLGEGIEKEATDFAAEVAAAVRG